MKFIKLIDFYNSNGNFHVGKEYTVYLREDKARLKVNDEIRILNESQTREFYRQVDRMNLFSVEALPHREGMPQLLKWEFICDDGEKYHTAQGINTMPRSIIALINVIRFFRVDILCIRKKETPLSSKKDTSLSVSAQSDDTSWALNSLCQFLPERIFSRRENSPLSLILVNSKIGTIKRFNTPICLGFKQ